MPALFSAGMIVEPARTRLRRDGTLQDWAGYRSAQGWIVSDDGVGALGSAAYWDPADSSTPIDGKTERNYTVHIWDTDAQVFVDAGYPESELVIGQYDVATPLDGAAYAINSAPMVNLTRTRFEAP